jgi:UDP-2,3-diacylglucosamine pyrophosphatase LpxH
MTFSFDLISDLHVENWNLFNWEGQPTSPYCVIAGDVSRDRTLLTNTLKHLSQYYAGVFYIDGNDEHRWHMEDLITSYHELNLELKNLPGVVYMQDNVVIINGVAILAINGWWTYDFDPRLDYNQSLSWYQDYIKISNSAAASVVGTAYHDAAYLAKSVKKLQTHKEVKSIVIVTHTVPAPWIVSHDIDLVGNWRYNCQGNSFLPMALEEDTENKIKTWCFGHYHRSVDRDFNGIRYVSNPRGKGNTSWSTEFYYPKRIEITI